MSIYYTKEMKLLYMLVKYINPCLQGFKVGVMLTNFKRIEGYAISIIVCVCVGGGGGGGGMLIG